MERKPRTCAATYESQAGEYFARCQENGRHPSLPGLALALGLEGRAELEKLAAGRDKAGAVLRRAVSQVEEANLQSVYQKDTAASAKFILQNSFGYSEKPAPPDQSGEISVSIVEGDR